ncbi:hypothetical protein ACROYT_G029381 [Oculina patagonica]
MSGAESGSLKDGNGDPPEVDINLPKLCDLPATKSYPSLPIDILLVTVKDCEFLSCYAHLRNSFKWYFDGLGYVYFGNAVNDQDADVKVALMRCNEGSTGPGSSLITLKNAATVLGPKGAISVGCCSGLNQEKSKLGDVVVSAKLTTYASKIVMNDQEQSTGTRSLVSRRFLQLIRHVADGWKAPLKIPEKREVTVHRNGEFLSGPEKVNADWRRKELDHSHPQAMAIEMEGEGLFAAAFDVGIEWLIAKGIADFADGNESVTAPWQTFASVMAASVVFNFLSDANVFREWPHFQELPKQWKDEKRNTEIKLGEVEENMKDKLEQVENQVKNVSEKIDNLRDAQGTSQDADKIRNDLEQIKSEIENMSDKLGTLMAQREETKDEDSTRDKLEEMKVEIENMKEQLDNLVSLAPPVKKKPRMEDVFDPTEIIDGIRELYKLREGWLAPFPWCEEFHLHLDDIFTRLKVVSRKKTRGIATTDTVNMSGIFKPHEECRQPRTVLIEGKPGMGKTTYCKKLVYDWATGKQEAEDCFPMFETVLMLRCRDMKSDLWEAIDDQLLPRDVKEDVKEIFFNFIRHNQSNVLLILDGLDEVPANKLPMFTEIIQGRILPKCRLVATARHEAGMKVRIHCDTLLEIEGFTKIDARKFIVKYFKTMEGLAQKLLSKLQNDENLNELTANPLNTALLCLVCEEFQGVFPESRTELNMEIVQCVLRRYIQKKGLPENNEDLIEAYKTQLKHLGRIALKGLREGNLDFEESELGSHSAVLPGFGFLSVHPGGSKLRPRRRYSFLHKSFQEWFAAFYLCCQLLEKEVSADSLASDRGYFHELKEVLKFTCGMIAARCEKTTEALVKSLTSQVNHEDDDGCFSVVLEGIRECKKENSDFHIKLARVSGSLLKHRALSLTRITGADAVVLAEALKGDSSLTELYLSRNIIGDHGATGLAEALKKNTSLTELYLSGNNIGDHGATGLAEALQNNTSLTVLDLSVNNIGHHGATGLAEALQNNTSLTVLDLSGNNIGDHGATGLAEALQNNTSLTVLDLSGNNIGHHGATGLAEALQNNTSLTELDLSVNNIGDHGATGLAEALKKNTSLTELDLSVNNIGDHGATGLAEALQNITSLTELNLCYNIIADQGAAGLAEALKKNKSLTVLNLSYNIIADQGAAGLAEALKKNKSLTVLNLCYNIIADQGAAGLAEALKKNKSLTVLNLSYNIIADQGAAGLAEALKKNKSLTVLNLSYNIIGDQGAAGLAEALKKNKSLTVVNLSVNNIGAQGATGLAEALKKNKRSGLARALRENIVLRKLYLHGDHISEAVISELCLEHGDRVDFSI